MMVNLQIEVLYFGIHHLCSHLLEFLYDCDDLISPLSLSVCVDSIGMYQLYILCNFLVDYI